MITQSLYIAVFVTRYINLFWVPPSASYWNFVLKNFYIGSSIYIIFIMMRVFPRTREREKAWKFGGLCAGGSLVAAPLVTLIFRGSNDTDIVWVSAAFASLLLRRCFCFFGWFSNCRPDLRQLLTDPRICLCPTPASIAQANNGADCY